MTKFSTTVDANQLFLNFLIRSIDCAISNLDFGCLDSLRSVAVKYLHHDFFSVYQNTLKLKLNRSKLTVSSKRTFIPTTLIIDLIKAEIKKAFDEGNKEYFSLLKDAGRHTKIQTDSFNRFLSKMRVDRIQYISRYISKSRLRSESIVKITNWMHILPSGNQELLKQQLIARKAILSDEKNRAKLNKIIDNLSCFNERQFEKIQQSINSLTVRNQKVLQIKFDQKVKDLKCLYVKHLIDSITAFDQSLMIQTQEEIIRLVGGNSKYVQDFKTKSRELYLADLNKVVEKNKGRKIAHRETIHIPATILA